MEVVAIRTGVAWLAASLLLGTMLVSPVGASASGQPTLKEREGITGALPSWLKKYPVGCVWLDIAVSNSRRYAMVGKGVLNALHEPCLKYASNGVWILKQTSAHWKIVFNGSDAPPCALHVPRDLYASCMP